MNPQPWWKWRFPNLWLNLGTTGLVIFGGGFLLRWLDGSDPDENLRYQGYAALISLAIVAVGVAIYVRCRRSPGR